MGRDTYVAHNAYFDSGGALGIFSVLPAAYIEAVTGLPFSFFFNTISGASIGGVSATSLAIGIPAIDLAHSMYACSIDLLKHSSQALVLGQIINQKILRGHHILRDHYDHDILYRTLKPHYGDLTMSDVPVSLLVTAHNMHKKRDVLLGCLDDELFDTGALQMPLVNGTTPIIDGVMATTAIPSVFPPYDIKGAHYQDNGMRISAGMIHKELDAALKAKQETLHKGRDNQPLSRRGFMSFGLAARAEQNGARTLANTDNALVRTLFLGTGDMEDIRYTPERQALAGFLGVIGNEEYSTLLAVKHSAWIRDQIDMSRMYDAPSLAATRMKAITPINRSIIPGETDDATKFPIPSPLAASPANLHKVFYVAALNVADNLEKLGCTVREIADTKLAQGTIDRVMHQKLCRDAHRIATQDPWPVLEQMMVTDKTGPAIYRRYAVQPERRGRPATRVAIPA